MLHAAACFFGHLAIAIMLSCSCKNSRASRGVPVQGLHLLQVRLHIASNRSLHRCCMLLLFTEQLMLWHCKRGVVLSSNRKLLPAKLLRLRCTSLVLLCLLAHCCGFACRRLAEVAMYACLFAVHG